MNKKKPKANFHQDLKSTTAEAHTLPVRYGVLFACMLCFLTKVLLLFKATCIHFGTWKKKKNHTTEGTALLGHGTGSDKGMDFPIAAPRCPQPRSPGSFQQEGSALCTSASPAAGWMAPRAWAMTAARRGNRAVPG